MCGGCDALPPWAPEAMAGRPAEEREAVLAAVAAKRERFIARRAQQRPRPDALVADGPPVEQPPLQHSASRLSEHTESDVFHTPDGSPPPPPPTDAAFADAFAAADDEEWDKSQPAVTIMDESAVGAFAVAQSQPPPLRLHVATETTSNDAHAQPPLTRAKSYPEPSPALSESRQHDDGDELEESVTLRRGRLPRRNLPYNRSTTSPTTAEPSSSDLTEVPQPQDTWSSLQEASTLRPASLVIDPPDNTDEPNESEHAPESPSHVVVSLKSPQHKSRSFGFGCDCDALQKRIEDLEEHVRALESALEARAIASTSLRARNGRGASPRMTPASRLQEECDSLRMTVDFRKYPYCTT